MYKCSRHGLRRTWCQGRRPLTSVCVTPPGKLPRLTKGWTKSEGNLEAVIKEETLRISCDLMASSFCEGYIFFPQTFFLTSSPYLQQRGSSILEKLLLELIQIDLSDIRVDCSGWCAMKSRCAFRPKKLFSWETAVVLSPQLSTFSGIFILSKPQLNYHQILMIPRYFICFLTIREGYRIKRTLIWA